MKHIRAIFALFSIFILVSICFMPMVGSVEYINAHSYYTQFEDATIGSNGYDNGWLAFNKTDSEFRYNGSSPVYGPEYVMRTQYNSALYLNFTYNASHKIVASSMSFVFGKLGNNDPSFYWHEIGGTIPVYMKLSFLATGTLCMVTRAGEGATTIGWTTNYTNVDWSNNDTISVGWKREFNDQVTYWFNFNGTEFFSVTLDDDALYQVGDARVDQFYMSDFNQQSYIVLKEVKIVTSDEFYSDAYLNPDGTLKPMGTDHYSDRRNFPYEDGREILLVKFGSNDYNGYAHPYYWNSDMSGRPSVYHVTFIGYDATLADIGPTIMLDNLRLNIKYYQGLWYKCGPPDAVSWTGATHGGLPIYEAVWHNLSSKTQDFHFYNEGYLTFQVSVPSVFPHTLATFRHQTTDDYDGDIYFSLCTRVQVPDQSNPAGATVIDTIQYDPIYYWGWDDIGSGDDTTWSIEIASRDGPNDGNYADDENLEIGFFRDTGIDEGYFDIWLPNGDIFDEGNLYASSVKYFMEVPSSAGSGTAYVRVFNSKGGTELANESFIITVGTIGQWHLGISKDVLLEGETQRFEWKIPLGIEGTLGLRLTNDDENYYRHDVPLVGTGSIETYNMIFNYVYDIEGNGFDSWVALLVDSSSNLKNSSHFSVYDSVFEITKITPLKGFPGDTVTVEGSCSWYPYVVLNCFNKKDGTSLANITIYSGPFDNAYFYPIDSGVYGFRLYDDVGDRIMILPNEFAIGTPYHPEIDDTSGSWGTMGWAFALVVCAVFGAVMGICSNSGLGALAGFFIPYLIFSLPDTGYRAFPEAGLFFVGLFMVIILIRSFL